VAKLPPAVRLIGIGWYFAFCIIFGIVGGLLLDQFLDVKPVFTLVGLFLGLVLAFVGGYLLLIEELGLRRPRQKDS
jgi:hypothetical protein